MKIPGLLIAAALLVGSIGATAAEAQPRRDNDRHHVSKARKHHNNQRPRRFHKKQRVCKTVWRNDRRQRVCRMR